MFGSNRGLSNFSGLITISQAQFLQSEATGTGDQSYRYPGQSFFSHASMGQRHEKVVQSMARWRLHSVGLWIKRRVVKREAIRMKVVHGHGVLIDRVKPLTVRSQTVKEMANQYIDNNLEELCKKSSVLKLLATRDRPLRE